VALEDNIINDLHPTVTGVLASKQYQLIGVKRVSGEVILAQGTHAECIVHKERIDNLMDNPRGCYAGMVRSYIREKQ